MSYSLAYQWSVCGQCVGNVGLNWGGAFCPTNMPDRCRADWIGIATPARSSQGRLVQDVRSRRRMRAPPLLMLVATVGHLYQCSFAFQPGKIQVLPGRRHSFLQAKPAEAEWTIPLYQRDMGRFRGRPRPAMPKWLNVLANIASGATRQVPLPSPFEAAAHFWN